MVTGTYNADDLISAAWVHMRPRRSLGVLGSLIIAVAMVEMFLAFLGYAGESFWARWAMPLGLLCLGLAFGFGIPYMARRAFKQRKDLQRPISFSASDSGFSLSTELMSGTKPWSDYLKWKEGKGAFLLYISDNVYQVVPKRFFASEAEIQAFRQIVGDWVARRAA